MARKGDVQKKTVSDHAQPSVRQLGWWVFLAFVPSSLMLGVTTKISTDLGSFPLIWVLPLSLYLLTFVLTFTNRPRIWGRPLHWMFIASMAVFAVGLTNANMGLNAIGLTVIFLIAFFAVALKFHRTLYEARPGYSDLTLFYVVMSVGGALGGLFNSIVAPAAFSGLYELPLTVLLAAFILLRDLSMPNTRNFTKIILSVTVAMIPLAILNGENLGNLTIAAFVAPPVAVLLWNRNNGLASFCVIAALLAVGLVLSTPQAIFRDRSFFGTHLVRETDTLRLYANGTTVHGPQLISEIEGAARPTPLFYYHSDGPLGQVITSDIASAATDIGVVGLGIGSMACFAQAGQRWQFYEIDALVDRVARNPSLFSFMSNCAGDAPTHLGDARVVLEQQESTRYDILVIDAYSSDAVPLHLTTNEAIKLYLDRLKDNGILVLHISNRYYDLSLPLGRSTAALGIEARIQDYPGDSTEAGNVRSIVVVMARNAAALATLDETGLWEPLTTDGGDLWTDGYTDLLSVLKWKFGG